MPWRRPFMDISWSFVFIMFIRFLSNAMLTTFYSALVAFNSVVTAHWATPTVHWATRADQASDETGRPCRGVSQSDGMGGRYGLSGIPFFDSGASFCQSSGGWQSFCMRGDVEKRTF